MVQLTFLVFRLVAVVSAQSYTGPMYNPSQAARFGFSNVIIPTLTMNVPNTDVTPTVVLSQSVSVQTPSLQLSSLASDSTAAASASASTFVSSSRSSSPTTSTSAPAPPQNSNAANLNYPGMMGTFVGGLVAGLAVI